MASGRMLRRNIVESKKFRACTNDSRLIYVLLIPFTDKSGNINADPAYLKGSIFLKLEHTPAEITRSLRELHEHKLITLFETDDDVVLHINDFEKHNKPDKRELESDFPVPDGHGEIPRTLRVVYAPEVEVEVEVEVEEQVKEHPPIIPPQGDESFESLELEILEPENQNPCIEISTDEPQSFGNELVVISQIEEKTTELRNEKFSAPPLDYESWRECYNQHRPLLWKSCAALNDKRKRAIKAFAKSFDTEPQALAAFANALKFASQDAWWRARSLSIDTCFTKSHALNWYEGYISLQENPISGMSEADLRAASMAAQYKAALSN